MSTIAYKDGYVAADSMSTSASCGINDQTPKLFPLFDGSLVALLGHYASTYPFYHWLLTMSQREGNDYDTFMHDPSAFNGKWPKLNDEASVVWFVAAGIYEFESEGWEFMELDHKTTNLEYAWGSGAQYARGAMRFGATAEQSVHAAIQLDIYTGGKVSYQKVPHHTLPTQEQADV